MSDLQATWTPEGLFFWASHGVLGDVVDREVPGLVGVGESRSRVIAHPGNPPRRRYTTGLDVPAHAAAAVLARLPATARVSDSVRCWAQTSLLALELGAEHRIVPSVRDGEARWRTLLGRPQDRERFDALAQALPVIARAAPPSDRGNLTLPTARHALRRFLDDAIDGTFRTEAYPGSARGWELQLAEALRSTNPSFVPRDARFQGIPGMLEAWVNEAEAATLRLGLTLSLPAEGSERFQVAAWVHPADAEGPWIPVDEAWTAGPALRLGEASYEHPGHAIVRGLARAARIFPPLTECLAGPRPKGVTWDAHQAFDFVTRGIEELREAGIDVRLPEEFAEAGRQRLRARIHVVAEPSTDGGLDLGSLLRFRWEVVLGDKVIDGNEFADLVARKEPIVRFRGGWVLLDPAEVAKLPHGLPQEGTLPAALALRAILAGEYEGVPVVANAHLDAVIKALRDPPAEPLPKGFMGALRPYQQRGYDWLTTLGRLGLGACLADDMGLGKTVQAIAHLLRRRAKARGPSLVVCPTSVLGNWQDELDRFAPSLSVVRYHGLDREELHLKAADVAMTTYGLLARDLERLKQIKWDVVILDEAQAIKNPESQRAKAARAVDAAHRIAMTGTPVENRLDELWSLMEYLNAGLLGPRARFQREVAVPIERLADESAAEALRKGISPFLLRRVKTDPNVITDLPDKIEKRVYCPLSEEQKALYEQVLEEQMQGIADSEGIERRGRVLAMLTALKQVCNHPAHYLGEDAPLGGRSGKLDATVELLDTIFEGGERVLMFTQFREMGDRLQAHLAEVYGEQIPFLHGGTTAGARAAMVRAFQEDEDAPPVLLVSLRAGGTGLNLTRATHVIHYDRWWNPAVEDQATDRAYRIGQHHNVLVHKLVTEGTLEERIDRMLDEKRELADQVVGSGEAWVTELDDDALRALVVLATAEARP